MWKASIKLNNKNKHLGIFKNEDDAAKARDKAVLIHYNGVGKLNFPELV